MNNAQAELKKSAAPKQKKRKSVSLERKKARAGYFFILPFIIGLIVIYIPIIADSIRLSFSYTKPIIGGGQQVIWNGLTNYKDALFTDPNFVQNLTAGIKQLVIDIPAIVIFALFIAVMLNQKMAGRAAFRAIFFVPVILSTGLIAQIDASSSISRYMQENEGIRDGAQMADGANAASAATNIISAADITRLFESMKIGTGLVSTITQLVNDVYNIINRSGVQMLIFLAGLQSISPAIYESCSIDGATAWETFWKITFPMISPMILVNTIYTVIDSFTSADNTVMKYITQVESNNTKVLAGAMSWIYFVIVLAIVGAVTGILSAYIFYQRRD